MATHPYTRLFPGKSAAPTSTDDSDAGYEVGDFWLTSGGGVYQAVSVAVGTAIWLRLLYNNIVEDISLDGALEVNLSGGDKDVAIYGDDGIAIIFSDASTHRIGIRTNSPQYTLHINGDVNIESGSRLLLNETDITTGWVPVTVTWTRTGNHTFTISGDLTAIYRKGTKVRYKDGSSFEYGVIGSSSHAAGTTTVNLIPNTDYSMAAATITDKFISYVETPEGFPQWFNFTTTPTRSGTAYTNAPTINLARWRAAGKLLWYEIQSTMHATTVGGTGFQQYTAPVAAANRGTGNGMNLNAAYGLLVFVEVVAPNIRVFKYDSTQEAIAANIYFFNGCYEF